MSERTPGTVRVVKRKHDGLVRRGRSGQAIVGDWGKWAVVYSSAEHLHMRNGIPGDDSPAHMLAVLGLTLPMTAWLMFDERREFQFAHCDAALPAIVDGETISFVDFDLDVIVAPDMHEHVNP